MTITVKKIALAEHSPLVSDEKALGDHYLDLIHDVEVNCLIRLGTLTLSVAELRALKQGQILTMNQKTQEPVDILLNQQVIARGELMSCEEHFAIHITEIGS